MNYFQGNKNHPNHISVGAVLINDKGEVLVHHFTENTEGYWADQGLSNFYTLMRKTININESLETALHRGLVEEYGATAEIKDYIGSIQSHWKHDTVDIEKTTLYFLCKLIDQDLSKREQEQEESRALLEWHKPEFLIPKMQEQAKKYGRTDVDESSILVKILPQLA